MDVIPSGPVYNAPSEKTLSPKLHFNHLFILCYIIYDNKLRLLDNTLFNHKSIASLYYDSPNPKTKRWLPYSSTHILNGWFFSQQISVQSLIFSLLSSTYHIFYLGSRIDIVPLLHIYFSLSPLYCHSDKSIV
jgi:hypothetical protein